MDERMVCIMLEVSMVLNRAATGIPMSKVDEPMAMDFHSMESSLERSESLFFDLFLFVELKLPSSSSSS